MSKPPFTCLSTEVLTDNPWHRYCLDRYVQTDGSEGRYYYIDMPGSCGTVPWFEDGTTLLVKVHRYLLKEDFWEFPIGGMKLGEDPVDVARKELLEEGGLTANKLTKLGQFVPYKGVSNEVCHFYLAEELGWEEQDLEPSEAITRHRMPLAEARELLLGQALGDGQSLVGLMLLDRYLAAK